MAPPMTDRREPARIDWIPVAAAASLATLHVHGLQRAVPSWFGAQGFHLRQLTWFAIGVVRVRHRGCALSRVRHARLVRLPALDHPARSRNPDRHRGVGRERWLRFGAFQFQPSEIAKPWTTVLRAISTSA
jgi:cell division protein FtsW (lipid II flippase)